MSYTLKASGGNFASPWTTPQSLPLPSSYSTVGGDCIVLALSISGSPTIGVSGCGGTWVVNTSGTGPISVIAIGYGCTAGGTAISVTGANGLQGDYAIGVFSGVFATANPIRNTAVATPATGTTLTTASLTYVAGDLLIGAGSDGGTAVWTLPSVWSNGGTDNTVATSNVERAIVQTYQVSTSGTSTTYKVTNTVSNALRAQALSLKPAPTALGNMLVVLGM